MLRAAVPRFTFDVQWMSYCGLLSSRFFSTHVQPHFFYFLFSLQCKIVDESVIALYILFSYPYAAIKDIKAKINHIMEYNTEDLQRRYVKLLTKGINQFNLLFGALSYTLSDTRWFKYDRDDLCVNKSQFVPVIFEPPCTNSKSLVMVWQKARMDLFNVPSH